MGHAVSYFCLEKKMWTMIPWGPRGRHEDWCFVSSTVGRGIHPNIGAAVVFWTDYLPFFSSNEVDLNYTLASHLPTIYYNLGSLFLLKWVVDELANLTMACACSIFAEQPLFLGVILSLIWLSFNYFLWSQVFSCESKLVVFFSDYLCLHTFTLCIGKYS